MESKEFQEGEAFKKVFKDIFKSELFDLLKSAREEVNVQESKEKVTSRCKRCNLCDFKSTKKSYFTRHMRLVHTSKADSSQVLVCNSCEFETMRLQCLINHKRAQHLNEKRFSCNTCNFKSYYDLCVKGHINSNHKESNTAKSLNLACAACRLNKIHSKCRRKYPKIEAVVTKREDIINDQESTEKVNSSALLVCKSCDYETTNNGSLKHHVRAQHLNEKRFSCNTCDYESYYSHCVKSHINSNHHNSNTAKSLNLGCAACSLNESHSKCLRKRTSTKKEAFVSKKKNTTCQKCSFMTQNNSYMKMHLAHSHGLRNDNMCSECSYVTPKSTYLKRHIKFSHSPNSDPSK